MKVKYEYKACEMIEWTEQCEAALCPCLMMHL